MSYLETLRRIPDDIVLAIFAQDFAELPNDRCICGWAAREAIARELKIAPEDATIDGFASSYNACRERFGGTWNEWYRIWNDTLFHPREVEEAVVDRLNEIVS